MPEAARGSGQDTVRTNHGCDAFTVTDECSAKVFVEGYGVVRKGDLTAEHLYDVGDACLPHRVPLTTYSSKIFGDGLELGRLGDDYTGEDLITGSSKVFFG